MRRSACAGAVRRKAAVRTIMAVTFRLKARSIEDASNSFAPGAMGSTVPALFSRRKRPALPGIAALIMPAACSMSPVTDRSACNCCRRAPLASAARASSGLVEREIVMTDVPDDSSCRASARPSPRLAPVTTATVDASMSSDSLLEAGNDEGIKIAVEHLLGIRYFDVGTKILDAALIQHVRAD